MSLHILYEDNHLLAFFKPAGLPTMGVAADKPSLIAAAKEYIRQKYNKPGNVYLGVVSRLDAPVTGVVLFARTSKAAQRLNEQFRSHQVTKIYWAIVAGRPDPPSGRCVDWLRKDERHRHVRICKPGVEGAQEARLDYRTLWSVGKRSLLEVQLETGRKHQIRVQLAHLGHPIVGDRKYNSEIAFPTGIALHARQLVVQHPTRQEDVEIIADLPPAWSQTLPPAVMEGIA